LSSPAKHLIPFLGNSRKLIIPFKKTLKKISKKNQNFSQEHIRQSVEKSLARLKTDYIDTYLLHNPPSNLIEEREIFKSLEELKTEGKIRFYGISVRSINDALLCLDIPGISVLQIEFNLLNQEAALKLFPFLEMKPKGIIIKVPLARGLLTGNGRVKTGFSHNEKLTARQKINLKNLEKEINKRILPEAAVRFILGHQPVSTIIAGTRSISHLEENLRILSNPSLSNNELEKIFVSFSSEIPNHFII
jgi:aryl-alcohol dehydrogenase-like predicted oxidoreductase